MLLGSRPSTRSVTKQIYQETGSHKDGWINPPNVLNFCKIFSAESRHIVRVFVLLTVFGWFGIINIRCFMVNVLSLNNHFA